MDQTIGEYIRAQSAAGLADAQARVAAAAAAITTADAKPADATATATTATTTAADAKGAPVAAFKALTKGGDDRGVMYGFGTRAGNVDLDAEILSHGGLVQMAYDFCSGKGRAFKVNHGKGGKTSGGDLVKNLDKAELVESCIGAPIVEEKGALRTVSPTEDVTALIEKGATFVGMDMRKGCESHWYVSIRPNDAVVLEEARKGNVQFSWGGFCNKVGE